MHECFSCTVFKNITTCEFFFCPLTVLRFECEHSNAAITTTSCLYIPDQTHVSGSLIPRPHTALHHSHGTGNEALCTTWQQCPWILNSYSAFNIPLGCSLNQRQDSICSSPGGPPLCSHTVPGGPTLCRCVLSNAHQKSRKKLSIPHPGRVAIQHQCTWTLLSPALWTMQWVWRPHNEEVNSLASYPGHVGEEMWFGYEEINSQPTTNQSTLRWQNTVLCVRQLQFRSY